MPFTTIINNPNSFHLPSKWRAVLRGKDQIVDQNGTAVGTGYAGQRFKVLCDAELSDTVYLKRRTQAILAIIFSFGILYCCSKIKSLLAQKKHLFIAPIANSSPERPVEVAQVQELANQHLELKKEEVVPIVSKEAALFKKLTLKTDRSDIENEERGELFKKLIHTPALLPSLEEEAERDAFFALLTVNDFISIVTGLKCEPFINLMDLVIQFLPYVSDDQRLEFLASAAGEMVKRIKDCSRQENLCKLEKLMNLLNEKGIAVLVTSVRNEFYSFVKLLCLSHTARVPHAWALLNALHNSNPFSEIWKEVMARCDQYEFTYRSYVLSIEILRGLESKSQELFEKKLGAVTVDPLYAEFLEKVTVKQVFSQLKDIDNERVQTLARFFLSHGWYSAIIKILMKKPNSFFTKPCLKELLLYILKYDKYLRGHVLGILFKTAKKEEATATLLIQVIQTLAKEQQKLFLGALHHNIEQRNKNPWEKPLQNFGLNIAHYPSLNEEDFNIACDKLK